MADSRQRSIKLHSDSGLLRPHPARNDFRLEVIFSAHGRACQPAQQGDLSDVCERIGNWPLEYLFGVISERLIRSQECIELLERGEESGDLFLPRKRS